MSTFQVRLCFALTLLILVPAPASAQTAATGATGATGAIAPRPQLPVDALMQDAAEYARAFAVPLDEAMHRLRAQTDSIVVTDQLRETYRDRWAGIVVEHVPTYRIVILLTGNDPVADQSVLAGDRVVPIVFRTGATVNRATMLTRIATYQAQIRAALPHPPGLGIDQRTGALLVMISGRDAELDRDGALRRKLETMTGVPVRIKAIDARPSDMAQAVPIQDPTSPSVTPEAPLTLPPARVPIVAGGARVVGTVDGRRYACTTGFVVTDGLRSAIATAAHCPDTLRYVDAQRGSVALDFFGQWGWGYQDVQINAPPTVQTLAPAFYADTAKTLTRSVSTWRNRESTRAGDFVCHRGERTGYSCALVAMVDFAPAGDLCGGACLPTWVAVAGPTCKAGDSGAPVFDRTVALGLVKGGTYRRDGTCAFYYYMSTDYLPPGWSLLYATPTAGAAPAAAGSVPAAR
jgi:hypothetical protein